MPPEIRLLVHADRLKLHSILLDVGLFTSEEVDVAMELIDIVLKNKEQKDYTVYCMVDDQDQAVG